MGVLDDERSILWAHEKLSEPLRVVVDDEEARSGRVEPAEAEVRRPDIAQVVVLDERLDVDGGAEAVAHPPLGEIGDEGPFGEIHVVVGPRERAAELGAVADVDGGPERHAAPGVETTRVEPSVVVDPGALVGVPAPGELREAVRAGRDDDAFGDHERELQPLEEEVHRGTEKRAFLEVDVGVQVELLALLEPVEIPVSLVGHVRPELAKPGD